MVNRFFGMVFGRREERRGTLMKKRPGEWSLIAI
jgi:hypothetical protein